MNFVSTRIITADIKRLVRFYERITGTPLTIFTEDFAELNTPSATLAIGSTRTLQLFGGDLARPPIIIRRSSSFSSTMSTPSIAN